MEKMELRVEVMTLPIGRSRSFTLIELLLVILIISILSFTLLPHFNSTFTFIKLKNTAKRIIQLLKYAQEQAISEGIILEFFINNEERIYGITHRDQNKPIRKYKIPDQIFIEQKESLGKTQFKDKIKFYPDGRIDKALIRIYNKKGQELRISIAITGKITLL